MLVPQIAFGIRLINTAYFRAVAILTQLALSGEELLDMREYNDRPSMVCNVIYAIHCHAILSYFFTPIAQEWSDSGGALGRASTVLPTIATIDTDYVTAMWRGRYPRK